MDRRKKRTSTNQYSMYIDMMEKDTIFATGRVPRDIDANYLHKQWKELSDKLNTCTSGPTLTAEEWRKRLNDWKNTTRCKYRRSTSGEKDITLTSLEMKALALFGKAPNTTTGQCISVHLKEEPTEQEHQRSSESLQKELQAAVEEAIGGDDDEEEDELLEEQEHEHVLPDSMVTNTQTTGGGGSGAGTTYRTILVENAQFTDDDNDHLEFITQRRHTLGPSSSVSHTTTLATGVQTVVTPTAPTTTVTKLINGDIPAKRLRSHATEQIIYEVKKSPISTHPRITTIHNSAAPPNITNHHHHIQQQSHQQHQPVESTTTLQHITTSGVTSQDARQIALQLKRLADVKTEKLKFEVARFKFNNPGFQFNYPPL